MPFREKTREAVEIPSSSLADIAFLLLVFFLVCTTIDIDKGLQLVLPGEDIMPVRNQNISNILINSAGLILVDGDKTAAGDLAKKASEKLLENPELIFSVKTSSETTYQIYVTVLDQLRHAGATRISIANPEEV